MLKGFKITKYFLKRFYNSINNFHVISLQFISKNGCIQMQVMNIKEKKKKQSTVEMNDDEYYSLSFSYGNY